MTILQKFHKACAEYGLIADDDHILVGLSGGKDSLALVELLGRRAQIYKPRFRVTALHVRVKERDYQTDLSYLERFCAEAKVPFLVRDLGTIFFIQAASLTCKRKKKKGTPHENH